MNLIDSALSYISPGMVEKTSTLVGESPASTRRALDTAVPTIVAGLAGEAATTGGAKSLMRVIEDAGLIGAPAAIAERLNDMGGEGLVALGKGLLGRIFGDRMSGIAAAAAPTGVKASSMGSILGLAGSLVLGVLGSHIHAHNLDAPGVAGFLSAQRNAAMTSLPASVLGALSGTPSARPVPPPVREVVRPASMGLQRFWPLLLIIPLAIVGGLLLGRRPTTPQVDRTGRLIPAVPPQLRGPQTTPEAEKGRLGAGLPPEEGAAEPAVPIDTGLDQFLSGSESAGTSKRFAFEHLNFDFATANLTPDSLPTLDRVAEVLNAHPNASILVEGHTDAVGVPADNERLSLLRANAVKRALVARGVSADRISTAGIGQDRPIASNDTEEGRARNRRTELVVTKP